MADEDVAVAIASSQGLRLSIRTRGGPPSAYDAEDKRVSVGIISSAPGDELATSWDMARSILAKHAGGIEAIAAEGGLEDLLRFVISLGGFGRAITSSCLFTFLDALLSVPRKTLEPAYREGTVTWHEYSGIAGHAIWRCEWNVRGGVFTRDRVNIVQGIDRGHGA